MLVIQKVMFAFLFLIIGAGGVIGYQRYSIVEVKQEVKFVDSSVDADGVPIVSDIMRPVVNGVAMKRSSFMQKYCPGKIANKTCATMFQRNAMAM